MSDDAPVPPERSTPLPQADPPTGYRLFRGAELIAEMTCPMCPTRWCICFSAAWAKSKRTALARGGVIWIETFAGVRLAQTTRVEATGERFRRSGPAKPPRISPKDDDEREDSVST